MIDRTKPKLLSITLKVFHHLDSVPLSCCLPPLLEICFPLFFICPSPNSFKMITSEKVFPVSLMSRCPCFWSTSTSITAVTAIRDAVILKCLCVCPKAAWGQEPFPAVHTLPSPAPHPRLAQCCHRRAFINAWQARNSLAGSWMCVRICVCVRAHTRVYRHAFSTFADEKSQSRKEQRVKGRAFCII